LSIASRLGGAVRCLPFCRSFAAALAFTAVAAFGTATGASAACLGRTLNIVAHADDDIIFFGAAEIADIKAGRCVRTIFVTAGDAGEGRSYWSEREIGADAGHAKMAGVARGTTNSTLLVGSRRFALHTLTDKPKVSMVYLRLPDGGQGGGGFESTNSTSLTKLWNDSIPNISSVAEADFDGATLNSFTKSELTTTLLGLMNNFRPDKIRMQNFGVAIDDHDDHLYTAKFAHAAATTYANNRGIPVASLVTGYLGYETYLLPQNEFGAVRASKFAAMQAYGVHDLRTCANRDCSSFDPISLNTTWWGYPRWLSRQYTLDDPRVQPPAFHIRGFKNKCMDVEGPSTATGAPVQIWDCEERDNQKWKYNTANKTLIDHNSKKCLNIKSASPVNGTAVGIATCNGSAQQMWSFSKDGELIGLGGKCLEVPNSTAANGTNLRVRDCIYSPRQLWGYGEPATPLAPAHAMVGVGSKCLTAEPAAFSDPGAVTIRTCTGLANQNWRFAPSGFLRGVDGKCATISNPAEIGTDGKDIVLKPCTGTTVSNPEQEWKPEVSVANTKVIHAGSKCFDVRSGSTAEGTIIQSYGCTTTVNQEWLPTPGFPMP
jgi:LmbE family N-acetylglucosaminyl deacetylase